MANLTTYTDEQMEEIKPTLVLGNKTYKDVNNDVLAPLERFPSKLWWAAFLISAATLGMLGIEVAQIIGRGMGILGLNVPISWGTFIINFVFWVGIGHAGTLISAVLFIFRQEWRMAINRSAEAMTIFAVMAAGLFPAIHVGRFWFVFWIFPYPNERGVLWPNTRSPLLWDVFAISTYFTISLLFWYVALIPDFASARDRIDETESPFQRFRRKVYSTLSFGWVGSARAWSHFEATAMILAGIAAPLVLSVHSVVSFDFATAVIPGWHTTIFPPYFVAGAIFSGFGMVLTLLIILREVFELKDYITVKHLENMAKVVTLTGSIVGLAYGTEFFVAWYGGNPFESFTFINRAFGPLWWSYWIMISCNVISPQLFWFRAIRRNPVALWIVSIFVNIGMWFERYVIVMSLHRDFLPSSWDLYIPTIHDYLILVGSFGLFFTFFFLFVRFFPTIAMAEVKSIMKSPDAAKGYGGHH